MAGYRWTALVVSSFVALAVVSVSALAQTPAATGEFIEFNDADVQSALRVLAEAARVNIVLAPEVRGTITIRLHDVPPREAISLIAAKKGYRVKTDGNVLTVLPLD